MNDYIKTALNKGEYYKTIRYGDFSADIYKHKTVNYLYVVDLYGINKVLTTIIPKNRYKKELDEIFFNPIANKNWDEDSIFKAIKKQRIAI